MNLMEYIYNTWAWYVSGPLIACVLYFLLIMGKKFGMSSNLKTFCAIGGAGQLSNFFKFDWKANTWNLWVVAGIIVGGFIAFQFLTPYAPQIHEDAVMQLKEYGINSANTSFLPLELFGIENLFSLRGLLILLISGFLVGFGARYAGGCTSGHAISGLSNIQWPSLIAVIGFFIGGLVMIHLIFPIIF